ncbi:SDR family oxidoreductase [Tsukamurella serpentis]
MSGVAGRTVVVTGANGALGRETVRRLTDAGAKVVVITRGAPAAALTGLSGVYDYRADLADRAATMQVAQRIVTDHGGVDGLVHLVGGWRGGTPIADAPAEDWEFLEQGLIRSLQNVTQALYPALAASDDARVAVISSVSVAEPTAMNAMYAAAKAAAEAWTLALADAFTGTGAAATILRVMALLTPQMRADAPDRKFPRYTGIEDVAQHLVQLWDVPAVELNGTVVSLVPEVTV